MESWVWSPWFGFLGLIPWFGFLGLDSYVRIPALGFLGLDSWVWIPQFVFLGLDSRHTNPTLSLKVHSWV